ncbi:MAG: glycosyltransferase family A protein [bacterium]|nr:glycosyltransferase family A protein [bacterium]
MKFVEIFRDKEVSKLMHGCDDFDIDEVLEIEMFKDSQMVLQKWCLQHLTPPFRFSNEKPLVIAPIETFAESSFYEAKPVVSVFIIAYNHEAFIEQAIESVLEQDFKEPYEILISDDASTDKTIAICRAYQAKYPDKIAIISAKKNTEYRLRLWVQEMARGAYCAFLEGDDYWCSPTRLTRQVELMRSSQADVCFGRTDRVKNDGSSTGEIMGMASVYDAATGANPKALPHMSSWLFATDFLRDMKRAFGSLAIYSDMQIVPFACAMGKAVVLPEIISCYRLTGEGLWTRLSMSDSAWCVFTQWILSWAFLPKWYRTRQLWKSVQHAVLCVLKYSQTSEIEQHRIKILQACWRATCPWWNVFAQINFRRRLRRYEKKVPRA